MRYHPSTSQRKGVVLLIVMAMLTLFAALGISFVFYADAIAVASQLTRQAQQRDQADIDPELLAAHFLKELVYGTNNPYSSMRGHSFADTIYGHNPGSALSPPTLSYAPYNGPGRQSYPVAAAGNLDNQKMVQYGKFDTDKFERRPGFADIVGGTNHRYIEGTNVPWTAYDSHTMALAVVSAKGEVLLPSMFRPWTGVNPDDAALGSMQRYLTLRPHVSWHQYPVGHPQAGQPSFVSPDTEVVAGTNIRLDVRNNDFGPGFVGPGGVLYNNDSIWMDLGFPIMTAPDGKRYRPLFAPLIVDLSNRLHLWLHGNPLGTPANSADPPLHVSGSGWGVSEVNLGKVITNPQDLQKLYTMRGAPNGTPLGLPSYGPPYAKLDQDAVDSTLGVSPAPFTFPSATPANGNFHPFPVFPASGWENNAAEAVAGKPLGRNIFAANGKPLSMMHMEWMLRYRGTNVPATTSELGRQLGTTLFSDATRRNRNMLTLWSAHLDRINAQPVITFDPNASARYKLAVGDAWPKLSLAGLPPVDYSALVPNSEFTSDWRSVLGSRLRVNLNRRLSPYPDIDVTTGGFNPSDLVVGGKYALAVRDRQDLAKEIYNALIRVTGAQDPNDPASPASAKVAGNPEYSAARWLAQLAVNIVDFVDEDDYMTPFQWDPTNPTDPKEWVFGTELPRLVVNEVYAQVDNDGADPMIPVTMKATDYRLNVWLELHNPFQATPGTNINTYPRELGDAVLALPNGTPVYQVKICKSSAALGTKLRALDNNLGDVDPADVWSEVKDWGTTALSQRVKPAGGAFAGTISSNTGFYVVAPTATFLPKPNRDPGLPFTFKTPNAPSAGAGQPPSGLSITIPNTTPLPPTTGVTVLLRRLANPYIPVQMDPTLPLYNPYITVDYIENPRVWNGVVNDANGVSTVVPDVITDCYATGRKQPYASHTAQVVAQNPVTPTPNQPKHTFYQHNARESTAATVNTTVAGGLPTLTYPFDWLAHLDRPLVNPLELLHVSAFKPHQLTRQFIFGTGKPHQHYAPWSLQDAMIYRVLDLLTTPNQLAGTFNGGMHPGKINLNTITEEEIFQALCDAQDAQPNKLFSSADVTQIYKNLLASRNPLAPVGQELQPIDDGNPFRSFGADQLTKTWSRLNTAGAQAGQPVFGLPDPVAPAAPLHPYQKAALMQKIYNNVTNTSNVFAVWWTVGFFEVVDETVRPARLGQEIGRSENRHIRHRFFAIVDRSALQLYSSTITAPTAGANQAATIDANAVRTNSGSVTAWNATQAYAVSSAVLNGGAAFLCVQPVPANSGILTTNTAYWQPVLQPGMIVEIGGATPEAVVVKTVTSPTTFTADFAFTHPAGSPMFLRGNPGPQAVYNPHRDSNVVLHMNVIK